MIIGKYSTVQFSQMTNRIQETAKSTSSYLVLRLVDL